MPVDPYQPRRYSSVNSAAGVMVPKEFVYDQKDRFKEAFLADKMIARRLRRNLVIGVIIIIIVLLALIAALFLLPH